MVGQLVSFHALMVWGNVTHCLFLLFCIVIDYLSRLLTLSIELKVILPIFAGHHLMMPSCLFHVNDIIIFFIGIFNNIKVLAKLLNH